MRFGIIVQDTEHPSLIQNQLPTRITVSAIPIPEVMAKITSLLLCLMVAMVMFTSLPETEGQISACWETWSRCTRWSRGATGILWKSCSSRCRELGYSGGNCRLVPSRCPWSNKAWQCQCYRRRG